MRERRFRLRGSVALEPIIDGWPAWLMLLDPLARGFYRAHHMAILDSFLRSPQRHLQAAADPRLRGGPFCDLAGVPIREVAAWTADYGRRALRDVEFAKELGALAKGDRDAGASTMMMGRAEVVRDLRGSRCVSPFRGVSPRPTTMGVAVWNPASPRPSMFSTPRLHADTRLVVGQGTPAEIGDAAALHHVGESREVAEGRLEAIGIDPAGLLAPEQVGAQRQAGPFLIGHASVALDLPAGGWLVTDPLPPTSSETARGLDDVRIVAVTHCHPDHLSTEALLPLLPQQPTVLVPVGGATPLDPDPAPALRALGFRNVIGVRVDEDLSLCGVRLRTLPFTGEHGALQVSSKISYLVEIRDRRFLFAADSTGHDPDSFNLPDPLAHSDPLFIGLEPAGAEARWLYGPVLDLLGAAGIGGERMRGATADEVLAVASRLGTKTVRIYAAGAPGMDHIFSRPTTNSAQIKTEFANLLAAAGFDLDLEMLVRPGQPIWGRST